MYQVPLQCSLSSLLLGVSAVGEAVEVVLVLAPVPRPRPRRVGIEELTLIPTPLSSPRHYSGYSSLFTLVFHLNLGLLVVSSSCCSSRFPCCTPEVLMPLGRPSPPAPEGWDKDVGSTTTLRVIRIIMMTNNTKYFSALLVSTPLSSWYRCC